MVVIGEVLMASGDSSPLTPAQMALLATAFFGIVLVSVSARRRRRDRQQTPEAYLREHIRRVKEERVVVDEAEAVARRLEEFARQMHAQIQTHIARLEHACREADRRIAALGGKPVHPPVGQALDIVVADAAQVEGSPTIGAAPARTDPWESSYTAYRSSLASNAAASITSREALRRTVLELSNEGHDVRHIAAVVQRSLGEIELLLAAAKAGQTGSADTSSRTS